MKTYEFKLILSEVSELTDDQGDLLYEAGCDDGTIISSNGTAYIVFFRDSVSLEEAIKSATASVQKAGFQVKHVEVPCPA